MAINTGLRCLNITILNNLALSHDFLSQTNSTFRDPNLLLFSVENKGVPIIIIIIEFKL